MTALEMLNAIVHVAGLGILFGAGIPALFAIGIRCMAGEVRPGPNGTTEHVRGPRLPMRILGYTVFAICAVCIVFAVLWIAKESILHYLGFNLLGMA